MGGQDSPGATQPQAYSTHLGYTGDGYSSDGYNVVINATQLQTAAKELEQQLHGKDAMQLQQTMQEALVDPASFGSIPGSAEAIAAVQSFVNEHLAAIREMGLSMSDFVSRVQAAAQVATDSDPATKADAARAAAMLKRMAF